MERNSQWNLGFVFVVELYSSLLIFDVYIICLFAYDVFSKICCDQQHIILILIVVSKTNFIIPKWPKFVFLFLANLPNLT